MPILASHPFANNAVYGLICIEATRILDGASTYIDVYLVTGYIGSTCFLSKVCEVVTELRKQNPSLIYGEY